MQTRVDVATAIGISDSRLRAMLYGFRQRCDYRLFQIPKRNGGTREIAAPPQRLLWLQQKLYFYLKQSYRPKECVHGFVADRSIVTNAKQHIGMRHIINFDLKDFFPSIHLGRVKGVFQRPPFSFGAEAAAVIAQICCRDDGVLPQGGATSPFISNLVCRGLDNDLLKFSREFKLHYTRYADDLTFSTSRPTVPEELIENIDGSPRPGVKIDKLIRSHGFEIHPEKVSHRTRNRSQKVTGLVVNEFPNLPGHFLRRIQGALHAWERYGAEAAQQSYDRKYRERDGGGLLLPNVIRGRLEYARMVRGESDCVVRRLIRRFNRLANAPVSLPSLAVLHPSRRHGAISKIGWNHWIDHYRSAIYLLQIIDEQGDLASGTAFHIGNGILATAGHNVIDINGDPRSTVSAFRDGIEYNVRIVGSPFNGRCGPDIGAVHINGIVNSARIPTQLRLPECGEEVIAIGYPTIPQRASSLVAHFGTIEALPTTYDKAQRFIQVSIQSGGGLSGGCLIDKAGNVLGIMIENVFMRVSGDAPQRPYGQAVPMEYFDEFLYDYSSSSHVISTP